MRVSPVGASIAGKIALPRARAWVDSAMFLARTPHGHYDTAALEAQLQAAGFGAVTTEIVTRESQAANARSVAIGYCQGTPMRNEIEAHDPDRLAEATEAAAVAITNRFGPGPVTGKIHHHGREKFLISAERRSPGSVPI
jgi:hypothetical protein